MNKATMKQRGAEHAKAGKQCTPADCREVDAEIMAEVKQQTAQVADYMDRVIAQSKLYKQLRGAFNKGWQAEYCAMVGM